MWKSRLTDRVRVSVLRRGESENNLLGIESTDIANKDLYGLTDDGVHQIEDVATERHEFDIILHSPLRRAVESARILSSRWNVPSKCEDLLIEVNAGIFENRPDAERLEWKKKHHSRFYPFGESRIDVENRTTTLLGKLSSAYQGRHVLLVTHGTFLFYLFRTVFDAINWSEYGEAYEDGRRIFELRDHEDLPSSVPTRRAIRNAVSTPRAPTGSE